jgi:hypothetical protein
MIDLMLGNARFKPSHSKRAGGAKAILRSKFDFLCPNDLAGVIRH